MDRAKADEVLRSCELVPMLEGSLVQAKDLERQLLDADIPVALMKPDPRPCCSGGGCGCGTKLQLLVREEDVPKIAALMQSEWLEAVRREGTLGDEVERVKMEPGEPGELHCPACGHAGPLVEGACGDCGLVLDRE